MNKTAMNYVEFIKPFVNDKNRNIQLFATKLEWNAKELLSFNKTLKEFDDGEYLVVEDDMPNDEKLARSSLNYIKLQIIEHCKTAF